MLIHNDFYVKTAKRMGRRNSERMCPFCTSLQSIKHKKCKCGARWLASLIAYNKQGACGVMDKETEREVLKIVRKCKKEGITLKKWQEQKDQEKAVS